jgi:hypothetical protein
MMLAPDLGAAEPSRARLINGYAALDTEADADPVDDELDGESGKDHSE